MRWTAYLAEQYAKNRARIRRAQFSTPGSMYYPMPAPIEFQLDTLVHATQINERRAS